MHADQDGVVPGNALVVDPKKQFRPLSKFGNAFLNRFQCSSTASEVSFVTFPSNPRFFLNFRLKHSEPYCPGLVGYTLFERFLPSSGIGT